MSSVCEEASLKQEKYNSIKMKTQKSKQVNVNMSPSHLHAVFKRKYKNESNVLNVKLSYPKLS